MRVYSIALFLCSFLAMPLSALAHGPQIQITNDNGKIVMREVHLNEPYSAALSDPKSVYVMRALPSAGVWYSRPNLELDPILGDPEFPSGPGLAYGYDLADGGEQAFAEDSVISVEFTAGLKHWSGSAFVDAGVTELKAFRRSNPLISSPPHEFAVTSDNGPFDSVSLDPVPADYFDDGPEIHGSLRYALLGDGSSPSTASPDGVYLVSMRVTSTQEGLAPSDPYFFVLDKYADGASLAAAVNSLGVAPAGQQWLIPEPVSGLLGLMAAASYLCASARRRRGA
jgi:hypothetical protein